jgi:hypothetical protein
MYVMAVAGIAVSYCRQFDDGGHGFGSIGKQFEDFPKGTDFAQTHADLMKGRKSAYAHYSPEQAAELLNDQQAKEDHHRLGIIVDEQEHIFFMPPTVIWRKERLSKIQELCEFQNERVRNEALKLFHHLKGSKVLKPGKYFLGETFP